MSVRICFIMAAVVALSWVILIMAFELPPVAHVFLGIIVIAAIFIGLILADVEGSK